ncbi:CHASE2 domain-containing protein [candidate division KSB1 bacterium]|nr:CHASE2 domain-containing protein [candidate division KSB1 bacterium]
MNKLRRKSINKWMIDTGITVLALLGAYVFAMSGIAQNLEYTFYDLRFEVRGELSMENSEIVIVAIDDQSFMALKEKWPFPRRYFARVLRNLKEAGAKLIVVDVEFTESSIQNPEDDLDLATATQEAGNVIYAGKIAIEYGSHDILNKYILDPIDPLLDAGASWGFANVNYDFDGFIRKYILFQMCGRRLYFPLAVEAVRVLKNLDYKQLKVYFEDQFYLGPLKIPKYTFDTMLINYAGPARTFPTYSFADVLDDAHFNLGQVEDTNIFEIHKQAGIFKDKIVLIGASAEELQDNQFTPFFDYDGKKRKMPGIEMHANALHAILTGEHVKPAPFLAEFVILVFMSVIAMVLAKRSKPHRAIIGVGVVIVLFTASVFIIFINSYVRMQVITPLFALTFGFGFHITYRVFNEHREKGFYRKTFQQYVAQSVVDTMLSSGEIPTFGGERRMLTVLFSDIRAFTTFSEKYQPEFVVKHLSEYLTRMVRIIFRHDGTLDKFVGDEIMALYGAPCYFDNHAERACITALDMFEELQYLHNKWQKKQVDGFRIGVGINTGKMIVGNLGSIQLFDYTVIGDEVNLGARLENANKFYNTNILISDATYQSTHGQAVARMLDIVRVKGKKKPVKIYELLGMYTIPSHDKDLLIDSFAYAVELFRNRRWSYALKQFQKILRYYPYDGPSRVYIRRCLDFLEKAPPDNWDGVFELEYMII